VVAFGAVRTIVNMLVFALVASLGVASGAHALESETALRKNFAAAQASVGNFRPQGCERLQENLTVTTTIASECCDVARGGLTAMHGTDIASARSLLGGAPLDAAAAAAGKVDGAAGFYLATESAAAEFFALRRAPGAILEYRFSPTAVTRLTAEGAALRPIPAGGMPGGFPGSEFFVPSKAFAIFNELRAAGHINVVPH